MESRSVRRRARRTIYGALIVGDVVVVVITCGLAAFVASRLGWDIGLPFLGLGARIVTPLVGVIWLFGLAIGSTRDVRLVVAGTEYYVRAFRATFMAFGVVGLLGFAGDLKAARPFILFALPIGLVLLTVARWVVRSWVRWGHRTRRLQTAVLVVGSDAEEISGRLLADDVLAFDVVGLCLQGGVAHVMDQVERLAPSVVVVGGNHGMTSVELREMSWQLDDRDVEVWFDAATQFVRAGSAIMIPTKETTLLVLDTVHLSAYERFAKRVVDVIGGVFLAVVLLPVVVVAGVFVFVFDGRPVLYRQQRVGLNGESFAIRKLRTMRTDVDAVFHVPNGLSKSPSDPRCTRLGRVLRRWSIDEIPQLVNVIGGSMSLVGPRPRLLGEVDGSNVSARRLRAKPGLTGVWQTSGRALMPLAEADALDVNYVDSWSMLGDIVIILRTVRTVLSGRGAF